MGFTTRTERGRSHAACMMLVTGLVLTPLGVHAQTASDEARREPLVLRNGVPIELMKVRDFLFAAYPDMVGRDLALMMREEREALLVSVVDHALGQAGPDGGPNQVGKAPIMTARFEFGADAQLRRYDGYGPLLHEAENFALQEALLTHPRWIDSDADAWLTTRGAASTFAAPSAAMASAANAVAERIGAQPVPAVRFEWHTGPSTAAGGRVFRSRPAWVTEAVGVEASGVPVIYQFEYEPFGGRLIAVTLLGAQ